MKLRSGLEVGSSTETVDHQLDHSNVASGNDTGPLAASTASSLEVSVSLTQQTVTSTTDDTSPCSSEKTNVTKRTQAKKAAQKSPPSEVPPGTDVQIKEETAVQAKKGQSSSKESSHGAPPIGSVSAASKGKAKTTSSTTADSPVNSTRKQSQCTTTPSKKRKAPAQQPAAERTRKRPRKTRRARGSVKKANPLTPPEDIPLPNLPECQVCWGTSDLTTRTCEHSPRICASCLRHYLTACLSTKHINQSSCPDLDCHELWTLKHISLFASAEQQATFCQRKREADPAFRRCLAPGCEGGRVYGWGDRRPRITCRECGFAMCFTHRMAWHEAQSCAEHDENEETGRRTGEEEAETGRVVKACRGCGVRIKKDGGCDQMECTLSLCLSFCFPFEVGMRGSG